MKFHIGAGGEPKPCSAKPGNCPISEDSEHYSTKEEAAKSFEKKMKDSLLPDTAGKASEINDDNIAEKRREKLEIYSYMRHLKKSTPGLTGKSRQIFKEAYEGRNQAFIKLSREIRDYEFKKAARDKAWTTVTKENLEEKKQELSDLHKEIVKMKAESRGRDPKVKQKITESSARHGKLRSAIRSFEQRQMKEQAKQKVAKSNELPTLADAREIATKRKRAKALSEEIESDKGTTNLDGGSGGGIARILDKEKELSLLKKDIEAFDKLALEAFQ